MKEKQNCHGCKWLDEVKKDPHGPGSGYCVTVIKSSMQSSKVRHSDMDACELYDTGNFATRYKK